MPLNLPQGTRDLIAKRALADLTARGATLSPAEQAQLGDPRYANTVNGMVSRGNLTADQRAVAGAQTPKLIQLLGQIAPVAGVAIPALGAIGRTLNGGGVLGAAAGLAKGALDANGRPVAGGGGVSNGGSNLPSLGGLLQTGMGIAGAVSGASNVGRANQLREQAISGLQNVQRPDLSTVFANPSNPYARRRL